MDIKMGRRLILLVILFSLLGACSAPTSKPIPPVQFLDIDTLGLSMSDVSKHPVWENVLSLWLHGVTALDKNSVFVWGTLGSSTHSVMLRSQDGGQHWQEVMLPEFSSSVVGVAFWEKEGWALVARTVEGIGELHVYHSPDAGLTWTKLSVIPNDRGRPDGMKFFGSQNGQIKIVHFIANPYTDRLAILTTSDGGITWRETKSAPVYREWKGPGYKAEVIIDVFDRAQTKAIFSRLAGWDEGGDGFCYKSCETVGQDSSMWKLHTEELFIVTRRLPAANTWNVMSTIPSSYKYSEGKIAPIE